VLQIKSMADSLDHLRSICSDRELKRMETERADLEQKVADLENELGNPRQEVRDAVRAERARCDAENKKKVAPLEQKVKALEAVNKILRAEKATAQRSASKAKNHWEIYREADFRSLEERVDLHHTKVDALKSKNSTLNKQLKDATNEINQYMADTNKVPDLLGQLDANANALKTIKALFTKRQKSHQKTIARLRGDGNTFVQDVQDYHEEELDEEVVKGEMAVERVTLVNECGRGKQWPFPYEIATMQMLMHATPNSVARSQQDTINWLVSTKCLKVDLKRCKIMPLSTMRQLREDAPQWVLFFGGLDVMRAKRLLTFYFDETEIDGPSVLSVIILIEDEHGKTRMITLEGLSILDAKTAVATANELKGNFERSAELVKDVGDAYDAARLSGKYLGMGDQDWRDHTKGEFGPASAELGDVKNLAACRLQSGSSDHCNGAMAAVRAVIAMFMVVAAMVAYLGTSVWEGARSAERAASLQCFMFGCQNHYALY
jgi:hypothetical protein|tara:strand:+ start:698 stop:2173 length:1476 start_codon:yes stop_codon:yes gene_type:complete